MVFTRELRLAVFLGYLFSWTIFLYAGEIQPSGSQIEADTSSQQAGISGGEFQGFAGFQPQQNLQKTAYDSVAHILHENRNQVLLYQKKIDSLKQLSAQLESFLLKKTASPPPTATADTKKQQISPPDTLKAKVTEVSTVAAAPVVEPKVDSSSVKDVQKQATNEKTVAAVDVTKTADTIPKTKPTPKERGNLLQINPDEKYRKALSLHGERRCGEAIDILDFLAKNFSEHNLIANFHYWIGECKFQIGDFNGAIVAFRQVFMHPGSFKEDDAHFMVARSYVQLGMIANAKAEFQSLFFRYPQSEHIPRAKKIYSGL